MAVTIQAAVTIEKDIPIGATEHLYIGTWTPTDFYTAGGDGFDPSGNTRIERAFFGAASGYVAEFIPATQKVKLYRTKDPANAGGADLPLQELAGGVDLHATVFSFFAIGA